MPPKSKVLQSPNYNQILDWIDDGKSSRWISRELKNQFGESIGHVAINNFRKKNITDEAIEIVDISFKAMKLVHTINSKNDTSLEDSITNGFGELSDAIKKSREILK